MKDLVYLIILCSLLLVFISIPVLFVIKVLSYVTCSAFQ